MARPKTKAAGYTNLQLRLPDELLHQCREAAEEEDRSVNAQILQFIKRGLRTQEQAQRPVLAMASARDH
jgi:hypothetical protein